jgi:hypothetical protein
MNKLTISIEANQNTQFPEFAQYEVARALRKIAEQIADEGLADLPDLSLYDCNGNKIGKMIVS